MNSYFIGKIDVLFESTPCICLNYCFSFFSVIAIYDALSFVATLIALAFHTQMLFNCFNSF